MTVVDIAVHMICFYLLIQFQQWLFLIGHIIEVLIIISFIADGLLLVSMVKFNGCFIAFWMIYRIMYIVGIFISWVAIGQVIYNQWDRRSQDMAWCVAWGFAVFGLVMLPLYNIHYLIVVKSYRKDNISQTTEPIPTVQYTARNAQVFIITRNNPLDLYGQPPPSYGPQGMLPGNVNSQPPAEFYNIEDTNDLINPLRPGNLPPYNNNEKQPL